MNAKHLILSTILLLAIGSCSPEKSDEESVTSEDAEAKAPVTFVADPQPIKEQPVPTLEIGASAPDFNLPGVDGKYHKLSDYDDAEVLVIIFTCNHCPTAQAYEDRMISITDDYKDKGVSVVAISPNSPIGLLYDELGYSDMGDTYEEMILRSERKKFNFPYLYDGDTHESSMKYGPVATPHAFVFDKERKLKYVGRIDEIEKPGKANGEDLRSAIDNVLAGKEIAEPKTKTFGCSIKWAWKDKLKEEVYGEWESRPVTLNDIDESGIKDLLKNDSENLRLVNIWATWCGPCVLEYPYFVEIHRMFDDRSFEFVSISADTPSEKGRASALKFLEKQHSALDNYIYANEDKYALIEAIDPEWDGALPYTALIEPGGKIVYRSMGTIDPMELKMIIVDNPLIGRFY